MRISRTPFTRGLKPDTIVCFQALHHMDLESFCQTCRNLLSPGGRVIISDPVGDHPLRGLGNWLGRRVGLFSPGERALPAELVMDSLSRHGFELLLYRSLNPTLEIAFHLTELAGPRLPRLAFYLKLPIAFLRPLENILEATLLRRFKRLGWRYLLVMRRTTG